MFKDFHHAVSINGETVGTVVLHGGEMVKQMMIYSYDSSSNNGKGK